MNESARLPRESAAALTIREAEALGGSFLVFRDAERAERVVSLGEGAVIIGRGGASDISIAWDERVSRIHAQLTPVGHQWSVEDDGHSRNGTFVNEVRIAGRRRLRDGDVVRVGHTTIAFREPAQSVSRATVPEVGIAPRPTLSAGQRRVLEALCRPCLAPGGPHPPAANELIATELHLSVDAVKAQLRQLFRRFEIEELPQIQKRTALVRIVIAAGILRAP